MKSLPPVLSILIVCLLVACTQSSNQTGNQTAQQAVQTTEIQDTKNQISSFDNTKQSHDAKVQIAAVIGKKEITLEELDTHIQLSLFNLEWQKYQLRKQTLNTLISQDMQTEMPSTEVTTITLTPPTPPRINLPHNPRSIKGSERAPVSLAIFCSYQSSHCARLQPVLRQLEKTYQQSINLQFFDFPQKFHRYGKSAANAFHCAESLDPSSTQRWAFQNSLYADVSQLNELRYRAIAEQLGFNDKSFSQCLDEKRYHDKISNDIEFATSLGLGNVPVVFINGLYIKGANAAQVYGFYIESELQRLGQSYAEPTLPHSKLPMELVATSVSNKQQESSAIISLKDIEHVASYKQGERLTPNVSLVEIRKDHVIINNQGTLELITIRNSKGHHISNSVKVSLTRGQTVENRVPPNDGKQELSEKKLSDQAPNRKLPPAGEMTLSREWLSSQLLNQTELAQHFHQAEHVVEGVHLLKLKDVDNQRFYTSLGLKSDDVIMRVNDQWVHEAQNPLWDSLEKNDLVNLIVMRKGLPYRYDYRIE